VAAYFSPELFAFFRDLAANNTREWFEANRARYVAAVEEPALAFIRDVADDLTTISPAIVARARRSGGSMHRLHRDTRFSADRTPFRTSLAFMFRHEGRDQWPSVPGFYLHLEPDNVMAGGGIYHPDMRVLTRIRQAIAEGGPGWDAVEQSGLEILGERLQRAPVGFSATHPRIEWLRFKDLYVLDTFTEADACADDFRERFIEVCRRVAPLTAFLSRALGLRW
jgi:uncharacterized protein (TIGR02453 family)